MALGVFLALAIQSQSPAWWGEIEIADWATLSVNDAAVYLYREPRTANRLWVREEYAVPFESGARSSVALWEVDCSQERRRAISATFYSGRNLTGTGSEGATGQWEYFSPGTLGYRVIAHVCGF